MKPFIKLEKFNVAGSTTRTFTSDYDSVCALWVGYKLGSQVLPYSTIRFADEKSILSSMLFEKGMSLEDLAVSIDTQSKDITVYNGTGTQRDLYIMYAVFDK